MKWWDKWPDRYNIEIDVLRAKGWEPEDVTSEDELNNGYRVVDIKYPVQAQSITIKLRFPPEYPYFMARAYADACDLPLPRHHNSESGEICLLQDGGASWRPTCIMAEVVASQMPKVLKISRDPFGDYSKAEEAPQGEPVSGFLPQVGKTLLVVEDIYVPPDVKEGTFRVAQLPDSKPGRYAVIEVRDKAGTVVSRASSQLRDRLEGSPVSTGVWRRFESLILSDLLYPWNLARAIDNVKIEQIRHTRHRKQQLFAAIYSEEREQHQLQDAWYGIDVVAAPRGKNKGLPKVTCTPLPSGAYSFDERTARSPELRSLRDAHVCLIGAGMLGSPTTIQLARAGVGKLTLVDHDYIELATTVRYGLGAQYAGWAKVEALRDYIKKNYPLVEVASIEYGIGNPVHASAHIDFARFSNALKQCDLVIDAAAEPLISNYLSQQLRTHQKPLIVLTANPGSWGGEVWKILSDGPCWECFERYQLDGTLPTANDDDQSGPIQIGGCAQPTAVGYGFDADMIGLNAVKLAVGLLTDESSGYPLPDWNALVINLRDDKGRVIAPQHQPFTLQSRADCSCRGA